MPRSCNFIYVGSGPWAYWQHGGNNMVIHRVHSTMTLAAQGVIVKPLLALLLTVDTLYMKISVPCVWYFDGFSRVQSAQ